jgi:hypothetical protein
VIIYELMDEMMDFGYPQTTESKILQECVTARSNVPLNALIRFNRYITQESHKLEIQARPLPALTHAVSWLCCSMCTINKVARTFRICAPALPWNFRELRARTSVRSLKSRTRTSIKFCEISQVVHPQLFDRNLHKAIFIFVSHRAVSWLLFRLRKFK